MRGFFDAGEYHTSVFEPTVVFQIAERIFVEPIEERAVVAFGSGDVGARHDPHRLVAIHSWWRAAEPDEIVGELEAESVVVGPPSGVTVAGFDGLQYDISVPRLVSLWQDPLTGDPGGRATAGGWFLGSHALGRLIILDTPAGSIVIIAEATKEDWDDFLPIAEAIIAGISFPDL
jgi:hypothetical protein